MTPDWVELTAASTSALSVKFLDDSDVEIPYAGRVTWESRQPTKVSVTSEGVLKALEGPDRLPDMTLYIVASVGNARDSALVHLHTGVGSLRFFVNSFPATSALSWAGDTVPLNLIVADSGGRAFLTTRVSWTSRNPELVWHSNEGHIVTASGPGGSAYLLATAGGVTDSILIHAMPATFVWPDTSVMLPGMTRQLSLKSFNKSTGTVVLRGNTAWSSSNPSVTSVDADGVLTTHQVGEATITAVREGVSREAHVRVMSYDQPLRFTTVSVGEPVCGVVTTGEVYCWGTSGLGANAVMDRCESDNVMTGAGRTTWTRITARCSAIPRRVESNIILRDAQPASRGACGLSVGNDIYCWGRVFGLNQFASGDAPPTLLPGPEFQNFDPSGNHACGIGVDGLGYCWGDDGNGQRGDGPGQTNGFFATRVAGTQRWNSISAGGVAACAIDTDGIPYCWGFGLVTGTLSAPVCCPSCHIACTEVPTPVTVDPRYTAMRFTQVAASGETNCAIGTDSQTYCWGGRITVDGNGRATARAVSLRPAASQPPRPITQLANTVPVCGLTDDGQLYCASYSAAATDDEAFTWTPTNIGVPLKKVSGGPSFGCGIGIDDIAYCWGTAARLFGDGVLASQQVPLAAPKRVAGQE